MNRTTTILSAMIVLVAAMTSACTGSNPYAVLNSTDVDKISQEAVSKRDPSICDKITLQPSFMQTLSEEILKTDCFTKTAIGLSDPDICERNVSSDGVGYCYGEYATKVQDEKWCSKATYLWFCYALVSQMKKSIQICDNISKISDRENCYLQYAEFSKDVSICENKIHNNNPDSCFDVVARAKKDPAICERISVKQLRDDCSSTISNYLEWARGKANSQ